MTNDDDDGRDDDGDEASEHSTTPSEPPSSEPPPSEPPSSEPPPSEPPSSEEAGRRTFITRVSSAAMGLGLLAGYGTFAAMAGRYLYPAKPRDTQWLYVTDIAGMAVGASMRFRAPGGAHIAIARQGESGAVEDFIALSSTCPHLGCQVHWEGQNNRFFCPCHNGAFDPSGQAIAGPPAKAGQSLSRYPLKVENGLLFIEVPS